MPLQIPPTPAQPITVTQAKPVQAVEPTMGGYLLHSPATIAAKLLVDLGLASLPPMVNSGTQLPWPVYAELEQESPDNLITTTSPPGRSFGRNQLSGALREIYGLLVRVRSTGPPEGATKANLIKTALEKVGKRTYTEDSSDKDSKKLKVTGGPVDVTLPDGTQYRVTAVNTTPIKALGPEPKFQQVKASNRMIYTFNATLAIRLLKPSKPPIVSGLSPKTASPGTTLIVSGTNLSGVISVLLGKVSCNFFLKGDSELEVTIPSTSTFTKTQYNLVVVNTAGESKTSQASLLTYVPPPPAPPTSITSILPIGGPMIGGTKVTITGINIPVPNKKEGIDTPDVFFGPAQQAESVKVDSSGTQLTCVSPPNLTANLTASQAKGLPKPYCPGVVQITVADSTPNDAFTFTYSLPAEPTIVSITPSSGKVEGGYVVSLKGTNLLLCQAVIIGNKQAKFVAESDTLMTVTVPKGTAGEVDVILTNPGGNSTPSKTSKFIYT